MADKDKKIDKAMSSASNLFLKDTSNTANKKYTTSKTKNVSTSLAKSAGTKVTKETTQKVQRTVVDPKTGKDTVVSATSTRSTTMSDVKDAKKKNTPTNVTPTKVGATGNYHAYKAIPQDRLEKELAKQRLGYSRTTFDNKINYFNISMLPDYENAAEPYFAFILMTRPSLRTSYAPNLEALQTHPMTATYTSDYYGKKLLNSISDQSSNVWIPLITTQAKNYSVNDTEIKTIEKGATFYGHSVKYGKHTEEHKQSNTISIDFRNDRFLSILKMMQIWMGYIHIVSKTDMIEPLPVYQKTGILDYAGSIYYLVTRRDMRELVYWEKLTGVFPLKAPYSIFNYNDSPILEDNVSIEFSYGMRSDPNDPNVLLDINALTGVPLSEQHNTIVETSEVTGQAGGYKLNTLKDEMVHYEAPFVKGDIYASHPYVTVRKDAATGTIKYFLHWRNIGTSGNYGGNAEAAKYTEKRTGLIYDARDISKNITDAATAAFESAAYLADAVAAVTKPDEAAAASGNKHEGQTKTKDGWK